MVNGENCRYLYLVIEVYIAGGMGKLEFNFALVTVKLKK